MINVSVLSNQKSVAYELVETWDINQYTNNLDTQWKNINTNIFTLPSFF